MHVFVDTAILHRSISISRRSESFGLLFYGEDRVAARLKVGTSTAPLPYQRQFVIGGIGTLRGYSLYEFSGNHGFLFNLEYAHKLKRGKDAFIIPFVDVGQVWYNLEDIKQMQPKVNLGIGFQGGPFRLNLANT